MSELINNYLNIKHPAEIEHIQLVLFNRALVFCATRGSSYSMTQFLSNFKVSRGPIKIIIIYNE